MGGIEAALAHSAYDWNLIIPVDVPFLPAAILKQWSTATVDRAQTARVAMFLHDGYPQPAVCLLHRDIAPSIAAAVALGEFKLLPVLEASAEVLALQHNQPLEYFLRYHPIASDHRSPALNQAQQSAIHLWFANLNTPQEFAEAEANVAALDT
jgi:molybdopterin-guanine dinucleotide biosynthesis protein A